MEWREQSWLAMVGRPAGLATYGGARTGVVCRACKAKQKMCWCASLRLLNAGRERTNQKQGKSDGGDVKRKKCY